MPFRVSCLLEGLAVAAVADAILLWRMPAIWIWHSVAVENLLQMAKVPWQRGREITLLPGTAARLLSTGYLDYQQHPLYPWCFVGGVGILFWIAVRRLPGPLKSLLFLLPASLAITLIYLRTVSPAVPYTPEDFCAIWYHGETCLWLLLPLIFAMSFFVITVPFLLKIGYLCLLLLYSFVWSAVRLAVALATFHYFGSIWMPFFYFAFGFLADFLYIVAFYSLAMDRAAIFLVRQKEIWQ